jgi:hypothetical protein
VPTPSPNPSSVLPTCAVDVCAVTAASDKRHGV